jgi:hypothetical protein
MVAMQVCDEDARDLADLQIAPDELVLCAFAAVEKPDLPTLRQA